MRLTGIVLTALLAAPVAANAQSAPAAITTDSPAKERPADALPMPDVSFDGPALTFDFPEVQIGVAPGCRPARRALESFESLVQFRECAARRVEVVSLPVSRGLHDSQR
jgi:hypothetical protein